LINNRSSNPDTINFMADVFFVDRNEKVQTAHFTESTTTFSGNENSVRVSRWVFIRKDVSSQNPFDKQRDQTVLLEVLLWRG
jgi:hypothetical protein